MFNFDNLYLGAATITNTGDLEVYYGVTFDPELGRIVSGVSVEGDTVLRNINGLEVVVGQEPVA